MSSADVQRLLFGWERRATRALVAFNRAASRCRTWDVLLGGGSALLTAAVGTAVFVSLEHSISMSARIAVGLVSVVAALLAGLKTFAGLPGRTEEYERAARLYGRLCREIEQALIDSYGSIPTTRPRRPSTT